MSRVPGALWRNLLAIQVYGANTGVGKTVASTLLAKHFAQRPEKWKVSYTKPVSTGPEDEEDERYLRRYASGVAVSTLFKYDEAVSPHLAAARSRRSIPSDDKVIQALYSHLQEDARLFSEQSSKRGGFTMVETAGGVLSPGPSGTPQADLYRPLRLPVLLVGDHRLGGISSTISAVESLLLRGYDIDAVVCFDDKGKYENFGYLGPYFEKQQIPAFRLPWIPDVEGRPIEEERAMMREYYDRSCTHSEVARTAEELLNRRDKRLDNLNSMAHRTRKTIWHPFTQHKSIKNDEEILVFDSAYGDYFQAKHTSKSSTSKDTNEPVLHPAFDGSASWWTQGLGHGNPKLSLAAAYAAGRYGHVMFAGATHDPALTLAESLIEGVQNPRLTKVFYSDNGSTAVEVGIKMALRAACKRYGWDGSTEEIGVIGLKGSYHGDTIGAMDASEPCVYNKKVDWYRGRGYWFDFPSVKMREGKWIVEAPAGMEEQFGPAKQFGDLNEIFDFDVRGSSQQYKNYIRETLDRLVKTEGKKFGALMMEPLILGAGGMLFVDPLFQRTLVEIVRSYTFSPATPTSTPADPHSWTGLPILFDEVFTGLYRLGRFTAASFLRTQPDISVNAKLLTGGLLPLSVTLASDSIFAAFLGDEKADALLHGHSYTAHPIGCHVANTSLTALERLSKGETWAQYRSSWVPASSAGGEVDSALRNQDERFGAWSMWTKSTVTRLSHHRRVDSVIALGSVLAVALKDEEGAGYTSNAAIGLRDALLNDIGEDGMSIHSRVLGNVLYLMASMTTEPVHLTAVEKALLEKLNKASVA
ncbi:PLP-dependent transferase [Westerdykella ornata]|uniref:PLP-dependent transferase n=1 Tax=Westerdykella ornata TaxID=318751 RepID=A0A6A6J9X4_WESOR|nr:PLP-dependent transferase [Westerdykella ornata]KAF2272973.1 PLP-dependent transferase [Westerdykella ornata]